MFTTDFLQDVAGAQKVGPVHFAPQTCYVNSSIAMVLLAYQEHQASHNVFVGGVGSVTDVIT